ncbi:MAG TPA: hypothetical protein DD414_11845 [Lachnospiraceae bacterium]|nr:hypothetical protein [Lachnospiraceae bacterium]
MMKDKKHMVIAGVAVLAVVLVAGVAAGRNSLGKSGGFSAEKKEVENRDGIFYGGTFDEAQHSGQGTAKVGTIEDTTKLEEEFIKNRQGETIVNPDENLGTMKSISQKELPSSEESVSEETVPEEEAESGDGAEEIVVPARKSKGYAEHEVLCDAESQEAANEIAGTISGTLISWEHGTATIQITGSVDEFLESYEQQGGDVAFYRKYYF